MKPAVHPYADIFPLLEGAEFTEFVEDIREHGLRDQIVLLDEKVLDGRNRQNALIFLADSGEVLGEGWGHRAGEPLDPDMTLPSPDNILFRNYSPGVDGTDPLDWVWSKNFRRRQLTKSQLAMVLTEREKFRHGGRRRPIQDAQVHLESGVATRADLSEEGVSERYLAKAAAVRDRGAEELRAAVRQGHLSVSTAETIASLPQQDQVEIVARGEKEVLAAAKEIRSRQRRIRFEEVNEKLAAISEGSRPLPTGQRFPIVYADPATRYVSGFGDRSIENHYPTMTTEELCALPVGDLAMRDAVLFVWSTVPQLANTMKMIEAWGFKYVSEWCWDKEVHGTGHWGFNQHEPLLIATRGEFPAPVPGTQPRSIYREAKGEHSEKPAWFAEQIERIWPSLPKIELFARAPRPGWKVWGNQSQAKADAEIAATEGASAPAAEGIDSAASRLADGRTSATAEDDAVAASSSADDFDTDAPGCTAASAGGAGPLSTAPPESEPLDIPAFLRRQPDNSLPARDASEAA